MIAATAALSLSLPASPGADDITGDVVPPARITIESDSPAWTEQVEWGIDRFRQAGLRLPPIAITVHDDAAACDGASGLYRPGDPVKVLLCSSSSVRSRPARLITLHELAHAWAETQLTDDERAAFLDLRGLPAWIDPEIARHEWGAEHAAEVVSWGLMDEMIPIVRIYDAEPSELSMAFDLLVDGSPLWEQPLVDRGPTE